MALIVTNDGQNFEEWEIKEPKMKYDQPGHCWYLTDGVKVIGND
jgi:hypothetical protein